MSVSSYVVKATYGVKTRKWKLDSRDVLKYTDLVNGLRTAFGIESSELCLKYKDLDGDFIELSSDEELGLAVEVDKNLTIVVAKKDHDSHKDLNEFRSSLASLIANATELLNSLDKFELPEKKAEETGRDDTSSPAKTEPASKIDPSKLEEVNLNDAVQDTKPVYNNGVQGNNYDGQIVQQHLPQQSHPPVSYQVVQETKPPAYNNANQTFSTGDYQMNGQPGLYSQPRSFPSLNTPTYGSLPYNDKNGAFPQQSQQSQMYPASNYPKPPASAQPPSLPQNNYVPQMSSAYGQPVYNSQQPPSSSGQQNLQHNPFQRSNSNGQASTEPKIPTQQAAQPSSYAPVRLTPGWNDAPPNSFFR